MLHMAIHGIRGRRSAFAGALVALFVAAVVVTAAGVLLVSASRVSAPTDRYAGTPVIVAGEQTIQVPGAERAGRSLLPEKARIPAGLVDELEALPHVRAAVPDLSLKTRIVGPQGAVSGPGDHDTFVHGWASAALTPFALRTGRQPVGPSDVVIDAGLADRGHLDVGSRIRLASTRGAEPLTVVGIAAAHPGLSRQGAAFVSDRQIQRLDAHPGKVDAIGILADPGSNPGELAAVVRHAVGTHLSVYTGKQRGSAEFIEVADAREAMLMVTGLFAILGLVVAMFVIAGTLGLGIQQREREIALLRAVAATPRQIRRMLIWEAVLVALGAAIAGYLPGVALGHVLGKAFIDRGIAPEGMAIHGGLLPILLTVGAVVGAALVAVRSGARRAANVAPTRALQEAAGSTRLIGPFRLLLGIIALAGGVALVFVSSSLKNPESASSVALGVSLVLVIAAAALGPVVARLAAWIPGSLVARLSPVGGFLAVENTRTSPRRLASAMTPLVLTVAVACTLLFTQTTTNHAAEKQGRDRQAADLVIHGDGLGVPEAAKAEVQHTPGVAAAVGVSSTSVVGLDHLGSPVVPLPAQMVDGAGAARVLDLDVRSGTLRGLRGASIALGATRASADHIRVGERIPVALGDGTHVKLRVVATYARSLGFGDVLLPRDLAAAHSTDPLDQAVLVKTTPGASVAEVAARLRTIAAAHPGLAVSGQAELSSAGDAMQDLRTWVYRVLVGLIFAFTSIAAVNTLTMIALARKREHALVRLIGATPRQVVQAARWEAALVVLVGVGLGTLISLATLIPFSNAITGSPLPYFPPLQAAGILAATVVLGFVASQVPTRLALRARPAEAIGVRE